MLSIGRWPGSGRSRSRSRLRDHGARTWSAGVTSGVEFARGRLAAGNPGDGAVDLSEIRRSEEIIDVLAERVAMPARMHDPAVTLLSALAADVDAREAGLGVLTGTRPGPARRRPAAARPPPSAGWCGRQSLALAPGSGLLPRGPWLQGPQAPRASWRRECSRGWPGPDQRRLQGTSTGMGRHGAPAAHPLTGVRTR